MQTAPQLPSFLRLREALRGLRAASTGRLAALGAWLLRVRAHEIELLQVRRPVVPLAWLLLGLGAAGLALAAWDCAPRWQRGAELEHRRDDLAARVRAVAAVRSPDARSGRYAGGKDDAIGEARALLGELNRPWHAFFDQLEAADQSAVHLVQLNVESRFATVQLIVESRDLDRLVQFSQRLSGEGAAGVTPGPIHDVTMTHHEWRDAPGAHVVSASMQGDLQGDARELARAEP